MSTLLEIESKFDVGADAVLPDMTQSKAGLHADGPVASDLNATYFDTPGLQLLAAGITLRRRTGGEHSGYHLKLPCGADRYELHEPIPTNGEVPARFRRIVDGLTRGAPLVEVASLRTHRSVTRLRDPDGEVVAELCDDVVEADDGSRRPVPRFHWREWEFELRHANPELAAIGRRALIAAGARPSGVRMKLARVLPAAPRAPVSDVLAPEPTVAEVLGRYVRAQVEQVRGLDPLVRADLPDAVHQMRVASRRLRAVFGCYRVYFDRARTDRLRTELEWLVESLGQARDLEVMRDRVRSAGGGGRGDLDAFDAHLAGGHDLAHAAAVDAMTSDRYFALVDELAALARVIPWTERASASATSDLPVTLGREWCHLRRAARRARASAGSERAHRLHKVRGAVKRTRYAVEAGCPVLDPGADQFAHDLSVLQDLLGSHHDAVVAREAIGRFGDATGAGAGLSAARHLLAKEAERDDREFRRRLRLLRRAPEIRWLR